MRHPTGQAFENCVTVTVAAFLALFAGITTAGFTVRALLFLYARCGSTLRRSSGLARCFAAALCTALNGEDPVIRLAA